MGTHVAEAHEPAWRCRGSAWAAGTALQSQAPGQDTEAGHEDPDAARLARFWADLRRRTVSQTVSDTGRQRDPARVDEGGRSVEEQVAPAGTGAWLAASAERLWRTGAVGHLGARLAGRPRRGALPGAHDLRPHHFALGPFPKSRVHTP